MRTITEADIIAARQRVAAAEAAHEQQDFEDALLASADLTPDMVRKWLDAVPEVHWCACDTGDTTPQIVCPSCGLPPFWTMEAN
jgi:hypothetical protein